MPGLRALVGRDRVERHGRVHWEDDAPLQGRAETASFATGQQQEVEQ